MNDINRKQNTEEILVLLFSQRKYYNNAEHKKYAIWISTLAIFLVNNLLCFKINLSTKSVIIVSFTVISIVMSILLEKDIELGAATKELIDRKLFGLSTDKRNLGFIKAESLEEKAYDMREKYSDEYIIQSTNTGTDKVRGVKDWYSDVSKLQIEDAILKCQKENTYWDKKLSNIYILVLLALILIVTTIFLIFNQNSTISTVGISIASTVPLITMIFNEFRVYYKFFRLIMDISISLDYLENDEQLTKDKLETLQMKIYKRRSLNFGPPNIIHQILSLKFHKIRNRSTAS